MREILSPLTNIYSRLLSFSICLICVGSSGSAIAEELLHDPTRPFVHNESEEREAVELVLQAVFLRGDSRQAVVNGQLLKVGDWVESMRIKSIYRNRVLLVKDQEVRELELRPSILSAPESEG